jgi:hypothetical protein
MHRLSGYGGKGAVAVPETQVMRVHEAKGDG